MSPAKSHPKRLNGKPRHRARPRGPRFGQTDNQVTLRAALKRFVAETGFGEEANQARWVRIRLGPIPFYFLNTKSRKRALPYLDLHHVLTGYDTSWIGEREIGAWEIASGCKRYAAAWLYDSLAMAFGLAIDRRRVFNAFMRGLRT